LAPACRTNRAPDNHLTQEGHDEVQRGTPTCIRHSEPKHPVSPSSGSDGTDEYLKRLWTHGYLGARPNDHPGGMGGVCRELGVLSGNFLRLQAKGGPHRYPSGVAGRQRTAGMYCPSCGRKSIDVNPFTLK